MIYTTTTTGTFKVITVIGQQTLFVGTGLGWLANQWVHAEYSADIWLEGPIVSYNTNGTLVVNFTRIKFSGSTPQALNPWTVTITCGFFPYNDSSMIRERKYLPSEQGYDPNPINNWEFPAVNAKEGLTNQYQYLPKKYVTNSSVDWKLLEDMGKINTVILDPNLPPYWGCTPNSYYYSDSTGNHAGLPPGLTASFCLNFFAPGGSYIPPIPGYPYPTEQTHPPYIWISGTLTTPEHYHIYLTYQATGSLNNTFYVADIIVADPVFTITSVAPPGGVKNVAYTHTFTIKNPDANGITLTNVVYTSSDFSIAGLTFNNGVISGTPTTPGDYSFNLTITCDGGSTIPPLPQSIKIWPAPPKITSSASIPPSTSTPNTAIVGTAFSFPVVANETATNSAATSFTATGLPSGLTINATSGLISGTPDGTGLTVNCTGLTNDYAVLITATNTGIGGPQTDSQNTIVHLLDTRPPIITDVVLGAGGPITSASGTIYSNPKIYYNNAIIPYQVEATNCPTYYLNAGLPTGLSISNLPNTPGVISGTPTTPGAYLLTVKATNKYPGESAGAITVIVGWPHPVINVDSNGIPLTLETEWVVGYTYAATGQVVTATNSPQNFALTHAPTGLTINSSGVILGMVALADIGSYNITVSADNIGLFTEIQIGCDPNTPGSCYYPEPAGTANWSLTLYATPNELFPVIISFTPPDGIPIYIITPIAPPDYFEIEGVRGVEIGDITVQYLHKVTGFTLTGQPAGVTVNATTGVISGVVSDIPSTNIGTFVATFTATNRWTPLVPPGTGTAVTIHFVIKYPAPVITSPAYTYGVAGAVFDPPVVYGGGVPAGYHITASIEDADTIQSYDATLGALAFNSQTGFGLTVNTATGVISGTFPPTLPSGTYPIVVSAINQGAHAAIPADSVGPGSIGVNVFVYGAAPEISEITPDLGSDLGNYPLIITGKNFVTGANVYFGNMSFVPGTGVVFNSSQSLTVTVPVLPVATDPYDVVVENPDGQTAIARQALTVMAGEVTIADQAHYTSLLNTLDSPIYSLANTNSSSLRKKRIFGLGTNVEVLFYSGLDIPGKKILNVYRKQIGTTSTRHGTGDIVFKGIASIQVSPFMYKAAKGGRISQIDCLLRSDGKVIMDLKMFDGTTYEDEGEFLYANYQAILTKELSLLPLPKIGTSECV